MYKSPAGGDNVCVLRTNILICHCRSGNLIPPSCGHQENRTAFRTQVLRFFYTQKYNTKSAVYGPTEPCYCGYYSQNTGKDIWEVGRGWIIICAVLIMCLCHITLQSVINVLEICLFPLRFVFPLITCCVLLWNALFLYIKLWLVSDLPRGVCKLSYVFILLAVDFKRSKRLAFQFFTNL